jgi:leucyl aminopeptidase
MDFELLALDSRTAPALETETLVVLVPEGFNDLSCPLSALVSDTLRSGHLSAKPGKMLPLYQHPAIKAPRAVLVSCGDGKAKALGLAVEAAIAALKSGPTREITVACLSPCDGPGIRAAVLAASRATYEYTETKTTFEPSVLLRVRLGVPEPDLVQSAFNEAVGIAAGIGLARHWADRPGNHATPTGLAKAAKDIARYADIRCRVRGPDEVNKLGMGAFLAVAKGSAEPLRFIELSYSGANGSQAPIVLIGKGITFDSGGISLKPAAEMDEMKFDMGGAASVLGVFRALAEIRPAVNVIGLIPACENLPSGTAVKPGDVVTSLSGQTIEILNTDAEGRLILCDALTYAARFKPAAIIDIATLTGACVIALGHLRTGLFANDDELAKALQEAGELAQDTCWRMPLDDEYAEGLKSRFADVANVGGRPGGAVTAAKFLQRFVEGQKWAHLDIAGTAWKSGAAKGATGRPVGLLVSYLLKQSASADRGAPSKSRTRRPKK